MHSTNSTSKEQTPRKQLLGTGNLNSTQGSHGAGYSEKRPHLTTGVFSKESRRVNPAC